MRHFSIDRGAWPLAFLAAILFSLVYCFVFSWVAGRRELKSGYLIAFGAVFAVVMIFRSLVFYNFPRGFFLNSSEFGFFSRLAGAMVDGSWSLPLLAVIFLVVHFFVCRVAFFSSARRS